jgi:hypothetical protein
MITKIKTNDQNLLVFESPIFNFKMLEGFLEILTGLFMLTLPLVHNLFLLDHHTVGSLLGMSVLLLRLEQLVFKLSNFNVAVVIQFVYSIVVDDLESVQLTDSGIFFIPYGVN